MNILASGSRLRLSLLIVIVAGALVFALAPQEGAAADALLAMGVALFLAEVGLSIADHFRSSKETGGD